MNILLIAACALALLATLDFAAHKLTQRRRSRLLRERVAAYTARPRT